MFCPHCGTETAAELKYCKRCGGPNPLALAQAQEGRPALSTGTALVVGGSTALVAIVGIGILVAALIEMVHSNITPGALAFIAAILGATLFATISLLLRFWSHLLGSAPHRRAAAPSLAARAADTSELGAQQQHGALPEPRFASVTEHTTRTFDNVKNRQ